MYEILFVDDDECIGFIASKFKLWNNSNFKIKSQARNGKEALEILEKETFDLIITDIRMPIIDGLELIKIMRENGDKTAVILSSTYSDFEYAKKGLQLGAIDYIVKPFSEEDLSKALFRTEKLLLENEKETKKIISDDSISEAKIQQWYNHIIHYERSKSQLIGEFYRELEELFPEKNEIYPKLINNIILHEIWNRICNTFPWITYIEDFKVISQDGQFTFEVEVLVESLQSIVKQYELNKYDSVINKICSIIVEHISNDKILDVVSSEVGLSKDYMGKLFRSKLGMTLGEYCTKVKIQYAKKMLQDSNMKVYEISEFLGYSTVDYFSKLFKNNVGLTPMQYRKQLIV
ncbi:MULTISPECIES: response regulator [Clostridium]|uniref:Stage 0 sporulation protein A homolog n=2 Tax=Clostridium TaxID=1485 RepID=A0A1S9N5S9_CLOBE|nr:MULTISPECIES: response regulator [Clostridium]EKQ54847.1 MAG: response regulator (CheY-like and AraC-type DNA-binding domain containing protein) [Clostridium sp. Maddingley MBC34-26]MZK51558.1 response regulator [Clostridium beijerinckii]MZK59833.1 response regulator [Clostridium beijerinckii]MZK70118.1 response regulator [Clostridium beijerinckii]MZK75361.1 response regulator [Clostridium beijerinckii]